MCRHAMPHTLFALVHAANNVLEILDTILVPWREGSRAEVGATGKTPLHSLTYLDILSSHLKSTVIKSDKRRTNVKYYSITLNTSTDVLSDVSTVFQSSASSNKYWYRISQVSTPVATMRSRLIPPP